LAFNLDNNALATRFVNVRNLETGAALQIPSVTTIVDSDGSYAGTAVRDGREFDVYGHFYGENHLETAGALYVTQMARGNRPEELRILGAFGAKREKMPAPRASQ